MGPFFPSFFHCLLERGSTASRQTTKTLTVNRQKSQFFYRQASKMQLSIEFLFATPKVAYIIAIVFLHIIQYCPPKRFQVFQISLF